MTQQDKIIKIASNIIEKQGIQNLTIRELVKQSNTCPQSLYREFKNKDELLSKIAQKLTTDFLDEASNCSEASAKKQLIHSVSIFLKRLNEAPNIMDFIFFNNDIDMLLPDENISIPNHFICKINAAINELENEIKVDRHVLFLRIWSTIHGLAMMLKQGILKYHPQLAEIRLAYI